MVLFLAKKPAAQGAPGYVPVDLVQRMAASGMSEADIADRLMNQGFSPGQIDMAMREALKAEVSAPPMRPQTFAPPVAAPPMPYEMTGGENVPLTPTMEFPGHVQEMPRPVRAQPVFEAPKPAPIQAPAYTARAMPPSRPLDIMPPQEVMRTQKRDIGVPPEHLVTPEVRPVRYPTAPSEEELRMDKPKRIPELQTEITLEELIEGVVAEYWTEFEDRLSNFERRDIQLQAQIQDLKKSMNEMDARLKAKESDIIGRFEDLGESMTGIQGRIGSIEKVFKDFIPQMTENVRTMAEAVEKIRGEK